MYIDAHHANSVNTGFRQSDSLCCPIATQCNSVGNVCKLTCFQLLPLYQKGPDCQCITVRITHTAIPHFLCLAHHIKAHAATAFSQVKQLSKWEVKGVGTPSSGESDAKFAAVAGKTRKRKDYAFRHQFNEKPSVIPGCPGMLQAAYLGSRVSDMETSLVATYLGSRVSDMETSLMATYLGSRVSDMETSLVATTSTLMPLLLKMSKTVAMKPTWPSMRVLTMSSSVIPGFSTMLVMRASCMSRSSDMRVPAAALHTSHFHQVCFF